MADKSKIEWTDATWNPIRGCSRLSPGCGGANHQGGCYAEKIAARFSEPGMAFHGFAERTKHGGRWTGKMALVASALDQPLRWKRPRRIFVNSMSDLFHENLPDEAIDQVFAVMALAPQHTFQVLTKRADRMRRYFDFGGDWQRRVSKRASGALVQAFLPNVWLGVSVEDQERADDRVPHLLATPAAKRFLSCEPLLGPVDLRHVASTDDGYINALSSSIGPNLDLVIVGGESGPRSRPFDIQWARDIVAQCKPADVACFVKQLGARPIGKAAKPLSLKSRKGGDMSEWPTDLRVREMPHVIT